MEGWGLRKPQFKLKLEHARDLIVKTLILLLFFEPAILPLYGATGTGWSFGQYSDREKYPESEVEREDAISQEVADAIERLQQTQEGEIPGEFSDPFWVKPGRQGLRIFSPSRTNPNADIQVGPDIPLGDPDIQLPEVEIGNFSQDVEITYDEASNELRLTFYQQTKKAGVEIVEGRGNYSVPKTRLVSRRRKVAEHFIKFGDSTVTNLEGTPILRDSNFAMVATPEGIRSFMLMIAQQAAFKAPIPFPLVQPSVQMVDPGAKIVQMNFAAPLNAPTELQRIDGKEVQVLSDVDILTTVELSDGSRVHSVVYYQDELLPWTRNVMKTLFVGLQIANPDLDQVDMLSQILGSEQEIEGGYQELLNKVQNQFGAPTSLQMRALTNVARNLDMNGVLKTLAGGSEKDAFGRMINAPTYSYSAEPSESGEWADANQRIQEAIAREDERVASGEIKEFERKPWMEHLADSYRFSEDVAGQKEILKARQRASLWQNFKYYAAKFIKEKPLVAYASLIGGSALAIDTAQSLSSGKFGTSILWALNWMHVHAFQYIPGEAQVAEFMSAAPGVFDIPFGFTKLFIAGTAVAMLLPAFFYLTKLKARAYGVTWSDKVAGFSYMMRFYGWMDKARFRKGILQHVFGRKNLFPALRKGFSIRDRVSWSGDRSGTALHQAVKDRELQKQRALTIAAAAVSEVYAGSDTPIDPAMLILLLEGKQEGQLSWMLESLSRPEMEGRYDQIVGEVYKRLAEIGDNPQLDISTMEADEIEKYIRLFKEVVSEIKAHDEKLVAKGSQGAAFPQLIDGELIGGFIAAKCSTFLDFTTDKVFPYIFMGASGDETYRQFGSVVMDERNANTAYTMATADYFLSAGMYAFADPTSFAQFYMFPNIANTTRIIMDQTEQVLIWTSIGGVDVYVTNRPSYDLGPANKPLSDKIYARERAVNELAPEKSGTGRKISWKDNFGTLATNLMNPDAKHTIFKTHIRRMDAAIQGFKARFFSRFLPLATGFTVLGLIGHFVGHPHAAEAATQAADSGLADLGISILQNLVNAIPGSAAVLLNKMALGFTAASGVLVGYATIWSPIVWAMNVTVDKAEEALAKLRTADYWLDRGIRLNDRDALKKGIAIAEALYEDSSVRAPRDMSFPGSSNQIDEESVPALKARAKQILDYSLDHQPIATVPSKSFEYFLNVTGTMVSTALYVAMSKTIVGAAASGNTMQLMNLLGLSMAMFGGTYFAVKWAGIPLASRTTRTIRSIGSGIKAGCKNALKALRGPIQQP